MNDKVRAEFEGLFPAPAQSEWRQESNYYCWATMSAAHPHDELWQAWLAAKEKYEPKWRPIETAPKEIEFRCMLAHKHSVVTGYWDGEGWVNERIPVKSYFRATCWMPIPITKGE